MTNKFIKGSLLNFIESDENIVISLIMINDDKVIWYNKLHFIISNKLLIFYNDQIIYATRNDNIIYIFSEDSFLLDILQCYNIFDDNDLILYGFYHEYIPTFVSLWLYSNNKYYNEYHNTNIFYNISKVFEKYIEKYEKIVYVLC
jgi:hypothetical protein